MKGILGKICDTPDYLKSVSRKRKNIYIEESADHDQVDNYKDNGWEVVREFKTITRMRKSKPLDELFEDRVWMIFNNLGFPTMNEDRNCKLQLKVYKKQVDVLAKDENNIFVVECRSSDSDKTINARETLEYLVGKQKEIKKALQNEWGAACGRVNLGIVISSRDKRKEDEDYVRENKEANIFLWSEKELEYIENLIRRVGSIAKFQLYSAILGGKRQKNLKKEVLALKCRICNRICYSFMMSAKELLNYAYVHHRKLSGIVESSQAYQRMLNPTKLKEIVKFIDNEEGFFPNSIIVNFTKGLYWKTKVASGDVEMGTITLPARYGCAWIIDGQHRLYGVASAENDIIVPVIAFENINQRDQANIFVEINEKQKKVPPDLLWDLYSDIYHDSDDDKQKYLYQIIETAKKIEESGPLHGFIDILSIPKERPIKLSLTNVCVTMQNYSPWDHLKDITDESKTPERVSRIINTYFEALKSMWHEDWKKGNDGLLLTNNGFSVFMMIFNDIIKHIAYKQEEHFLRPSKKEEFKELLKKKYLTPVIEFLKNHKKLQEEIRSLAGRGPQSDSAGLLDVKIQDFVPDFSPPRAGDISPLVSSTEKPTAISDLEEKARESEGFLRKFALEKLKSHYGSIKWWKQGLTDGAKNEADKLWNKEVERKPHLRVEKNLLERKFELLGFGNISDIIIYGENWGGIFESIFLNKDNFKRRIIDITVLRNPTSHIRQPDDQDVIDGTGGLLWLSNCLGYPDINPYR